METRVRPARPADKTPLMAFIKDVWGGHDYIPRVWDDWIRDREGRMFVVEADGHPVGMNRIRFLEDGSAWFEGARVHPEFRGMGLASMLGENSMMVARRRGVEVFRLTSGSHNKAAHRQIARMDFHRASKWSVYKPPEGHVPPRLAEGREAKPGELDEVMEALKRSREFKLGAGVFWDEFTAAELTRDVVRNLIGRREVWRLGGAVAVARDGGEGAQKWEQVCFVGGPWADGVKLVGSLLGKSPRASARWVYVPQRSPLIHALRSRGYGRDFAMILFERKAPKG